MMCGCEDWLLGFRLAQCVFMEEETTAAPWLESSEDWHISRETSENIRPGMYVYQPGVQSFVLVSGCTMLRNPDLVFIDLRDGRTVCLPFGEPIYTRTEGF